MSRFVIKRNGDDEVHFFIDDEEVGYTDHDLSGWDGIQLGEDLFTAIAHKLGFDVEDEEYGGDE